MIKFIMLLMFITNSYCELLEFNSTNFPNIKEKRVFDLSVDTMRLVRDNQKILAQYKQSTEYYVASEYPKITTVVRLSDKADASLAVYFDENINFKINSRILGFYLNSGKLYLDDESLILRDFDKLEPKVFEMLLNFRQHLFKIKEKFELEEKNILFLLNGSSYEKRK